MSGPTFCRVGGVLVGLCQRGQLSCVFLHGYVCRCLSVCGCWFYVVGSMLFVFHGRVLVSASVLFFRFGMLGLDPGPLVCVLGGQEG